MPDVSVVDLTARLEKPAVYEEINQVFMKAAEGELKGMLGYTEDDVVSEDFSGDSRTSIVSAKAGILRNPHVIKLVSWHDNEWGYSDKLVDWSNWSVGSKIN